jgi:hypothetical protein
MAGSSRGNPKLGDVVRSVVVLGGVLVLVWGATRLLFGGAPDTPDVPAVDYVAVLPGAERETGADLLAPSSLPDGWKVTSSRVRDGVWSLGTLVDDERFVGLTQAPEAEERAVEEYAEGSRREGTVDVGGTTWTRWSSPDGETTYSRVVPGPQEDTTAVVTSDLDRADVERYLASLS